MGNQNDKGNEGEAFVNELTYNTYLKYWCYPNPKDINGDNKEICDLLILFRDIAIIISVKNHTFDGNYDRYTKKVIEKSTNQLNGAYRKLFNSGRDIYIQHPEREPELFHPGKYTKVFKITINVGEQFEYYSLGENHNKGFINIFNKDTFEAIIYELDTIKDLVEYLEEREKLLSSGKILVVNCQEKDMLAEFVTNVRSFPIDYSPDGIKVIELNLGGAWNKYIGSKALARKKEADKASYFIDDLVKNDVLKVPDGEKLAKELMNLSRFERRMLSKSFLSLIAKYENTGEEILARRYVSYNGIGHLLIYYPPNIPEKDVDQIVQVAMPIYAYKGGYKETEIILIAATDNMKQWKFGFYTAAGTTEEGKRYLDELIKNFGWFQNEQAFYYHENEYPDE